MPVTGCLPTGQGRLQTLRSLNVALGDDDPLGSFVFRTTGFNSIRTLSARLQYFQAISGNKLSCLALELFTWEIDASESGNADLLRGYHAQIRLSTEERSWRRLSNWMEHAGRLLDQRWIKRLSKGWVTEHLRRAKRTVGQWFWTSSLLLHRD